MSGPIVSVGPGDPCTPGAAACGTVGAMHEVTTRFEIPKPIDGGEDEVSMDDAMPQPAVAPCCADSCRRHAAADSSSCCARASPVEMSSCRWMNIDRQQSVGITGSASSAGLVQGCSKWSGGASGGWLHGVTKMAENGPF